MIEIGIGLLVGATVAGVGVGYAAHLREQRQPPPPPPRVQVWQGATLLYDGPERRSAPRIRLDAAYRWPPVEETDPGAECDVEHARRWAGQNDPMLTPIEGGGDE